MVSRKLAIRDEHNIRLRCSRNVKNSLLDRQRQRDRERRGDEREEDKTREEIREKREDSFSVWLCMAVVG